MTNDQKVQHLRAAAELIRTYGLAKGSYRRGGLLGPRPETARLECGHCAMGAVSDAVDPTIIDSGLISGHPLTEPLLVEVARTINPDRQPLTTEEYDDISARVGWDWRQKDWFFTTISGWNDHPDRTADEVVAVLEATADRLQKEG